MGERGYSGRGLFRTAAFSTCYKSIKKIIFYQMMHNHVRYWYGLKIIISFRVI
jgi:hypothetical protein